MPKPSKNVEEVEAEEADFYYALADRARTLRGRHSELTLARCGALMGVTESMASLKFKGAKWSAFEVEVMAKAFKVSPSVLFGSESMPEPVRPARVTKLQPKSRTLVPKVAGSNPVGGTLIPFPARTIEASAPRDAVVLPFPGVA